MAFNGLPGPAEGPKPGRPVCAAPFGLGGFAPARLQTWLLKLHLAVVRYRSAGWWSTRSDCGARNDYTGILWLLIRCAGSPARTVLSRRLHARGCMPGGYTPLFTCPGYCGTPFG